MVESPPPMFCAKCGAKISATGRFCSSCGEAVDTDSGATFLGDEASLEGPTIAPGPPSSRKTPLPHLSPRTPRTALSSNPISSSDPIGGGRFTPGQIIAERYRVVALAGRGGMGEVYRAEDLTLEQVVALKFLPTALSQDAAALARFHAEVRTARQVSHPNVCRMFDIGEADGTLFLTMEYVDGEDLASVVRRIGRITPDKATEIARQICAGLAAAHERGVIHRDLKPANVMLDGAGKIRLTDFGLAGIAASIKGADVRSGTPAYMAPEQLAGRAVSSKSDIYSLGLVLYEILTGKRAFEAPTLPELMKQRESGAITNPSTLVRDLDPLIERVILRCLELEPEKRPSTPLQVAAALPGGDRLAAALAAAETPSPQMVAASGETEGLAPRIAVTCLAVLLFGVILSYFLGVRISIYDKMRTEQSPEVLTHRAQEIAASAGYTTPPADTAYGFDNDDQYEQYAKQNDKPVPNWDDLLKKSPPILRFWYRSSPQLMVATDYRESSLTPGIVTENDPPFTAPGMVSIILDLDGRLISFESIPPQREDRPEGIKPVDWSPLFAAAGLDPKALISSQPIWNSLASSDTRAAWTGTWPGSTRPLRLEAAALHGKPVSFSLFGPWTPAWRQNPDQSTKAQQAGAIILVIVACTVMLGAIFFAYRNYQVRRTDPRGALRLVLFVFAVQMALWIFRAHFTMSISTFGGIVIAISTSLFWGVMVALVYLALEPYVRRRWPHSIISWSRLLLGRWRDPLVGRDVLFGFVLGTFWVIVIQLFIAYLIRIGAVPHIGDAEFLLGVRRTLGAGLLLVPADIRTTLLFFFLIFLLRLVLRNEWLAAGAFVVLFSIMQSLREEYFWVAFIVFLIIYSLAASALVRFGLVSLAAALFL